MLRGLIRGLALCLVGVVPIHVRAPRDSPTFRLAGMDDAARVTGTPPPLDLHVTVAELLAQDDD